MLGLFEEINHTHTDTLTTFNPVTTSVFLIIDKKGENETVKVEMLVVVRLGGGGGWSVESGMGFLLPRLRCFSQGTVGYCRTAQ